MCKAEIRVEGGKPLNHPNFAVKTKSVAHRRLLFTPTVPYIRGVLIIEYAFKAPISELQSYFVT
ncbi:MAG: hypothetical protein D0433_14015 [Candidatus Thermochlorobacter aerophilum]|uniref:Uncharacterized protein n=1 Tax=Candidatus Thermochlorobacter aerophilus TaxID=1868324 RepID=A0A395LW58_9BACT|nr:MAG: hypothetical protein D0433_14015 [Candidatus Thermochlorobacter aerophilum]